MPRVITPRFRCAGRERQQNVAIQFSLREISHGAYYESMNRESHGNADVHGSRIQTTSTLEMKCDVENKGPSLGAHGFVFIGSFNVVPAVQDWF